MDLDPIAGVDLERYAAVIRDAALADHDGATLSAMAALHGIDQLAWDDAHAGWSERIRSDAAVEALFAVLARP